MSGWLIPPPSEPVKSGDDLRRERDAKIAELQRRGLLRSERLRTATSDRGVAFGAPLGHRSSPGICLLRSSLR